MRNRKICTLSSMALFGAFSLVLARPANAAIIIPANQWGSGGGHVDTNISAYFGPGFCTFNEGNGGTGPSCSIDAVSNLPPGPPFNYSGEGHGAITAYTDANGAHVQALASALNEGYAYASAAAYFSDTETNNTSAVKQFQIAFHVDALVSSNSNSVATFEVDFTPLYSGMTFVYGKTKAFGGAATAIGVNSDFTTPLITVNPHSSLTWDVVMYATAVAQSHQNSIYPAGPPQASSNAGNTLSMTGFSVYDSQGNPLDTSALTSSDGFNYTNTTGPSAPEPSTMALFATGTALLVRARLKRHSNRVQDIV